MKDWIRSPSPGGYERPSATAPGARGGPFDEEGSSSSSGAAANKDGDKTELDFVDLRTEQGRARAAAAAGAAGVIGRRGVVGVDRPSDANVVLYGGTENGTMPGASSASTSGGSAGAGVGMRAPPSLKSLCLSIICRNIHQVHDLGLMSYAMAKSILEQCQADQLEEILRRSPHLAPDAEVLWKKLCLSDFVQIRKDAEAGKLGEPESWRKLYWRSVEEVEEHKANVKERLRSRYASARAAKDDRRILISERPLVRLDGGGGSAASGGAPVRWTTGVFGASNGGLGGNGRPRANEQGQGMLARAAAGKTRRPRMLPSPASRLTIRPPSRASGGVLAQGEMLAAARKRKAGAIVSPGLGEGKGWTGMHPADLVYQPAHKVKVANGVGSTSVRSNGGSPSRSEGRQHAKASSSSSSNRGAEAASPQAAPSSTTTTTRIVKTVVPRTKLVPPGGIDFFGSNPGPSSTSTRHSKVTSLRRSTDQPSRMTKTKATTAAAGSPTTAGASSPPAVVTTIRTSAPQVRRTQAAPVTPTSSKTTAAPTTRPSHTSTNGNGSGLHQERVAVRGAVD